MTLGSATTRVHVLWLSKATDNHHERLTAALKSLKAKSFSKD